MLNSLFQIGSYPEFLINKRVDPEFLLQKKKRKKKASFTLIIYTMFLCCNLIIGNKLAFLNVVSKYENLFPVFQIF